MINPHHLRSFFSTILQFIIVTAAAQPYALWTKNELTLNNGVVERFIQLPSGSGAFITTNYRPLGTDLNYFTRTSADFMAPGK